MASVWTDIPDSDIDPDSPFTTGLATSYRENVIAAFEGASGAPRSVEESVNEITAGSSYRIGLAISAGADSVETGIVYTTQNLSITVPRSGTYQVTFEIKQTGASTAYGKIYRNASISYSGDVAFGTEQSTTSASYVTKIESLTLNAGDMLTLYVKRVAGTSSDTRNFRIDAAVKQHG